MAADYRYAICDVFTDVPLEGNPLAVFCDARGIPEERLQRIAREINLSETVFVYPPEAGGDVRVHNGGRQFESQDDPDFKIMAAWVRGQKAGGSSAP